MIIDVNMHHLPENLFDNEEALNGFLTTSPRGYGVVSYMGKTEAGKRQIIVEQPKDCQVLNYVEGDYSLEMKLKAMDENGVDKAILRVPVWQEWLRIETCRLVNDNAADMCKRSGGRLYANACVPPWNFKENIYELERCVKELGMVGVQLACHYGQIYLDDEAFKPYLKAIEKLGVPVVVHHTPGPVHWQSLYEYTNIRRELGRITDQATAVGRELYSGMFDEMPGLKFIHTMFGGNWFANYNITNPKKGKKKEAMERLANDDHERILGFLRNNLYFDTTHPASWGKEQVECAIKVCGADHILFSSSFPVFYNWMSDGVEFMKALNLSDTDRDLVMSGNAVRLFNLKV
jgi:predicted TIM-barrel fold metal-dependent hydrolase